MTAQELINHANEVEAIKQMIVKERVRIHQLHSVEQSKVWVFYTKSEREEWYKKFFHELEIKEAAIKRLKERYTKILYKFTDEQN